MGEKRPTRKRAIREKCLECSAGQRNEVKNCTVKSCPLYPFRMGKDPFRTAGARPNNGEALKRWREQQKELKDKGTE